MGALKMALEWDCSVRLLTPALSPSNEVQSLNSKLPLSLTSSIKNYYEFLRDRFQIPLQTQTCVIFSFISRELQKKAVFSPFFGVRWRLMCCGATGDARETGDPAIRRTALVYSHSFKKNTGLFEGAFRSPQWEGQPRGILDMEEKIGRASCRERV